MKHLIKSSITFLIFLFLVDSISFAQEEQQIPPEFFTGRWYGNISGSCIEIENTQDVKTGFIMDPINITVENDLTFSGWAKVSFEEPEWVLKTDLEDYYVDYTFEKSEISGEIKGRIWRANDYVNFRFHNLRPTATHTWSFSGLGETKTYRAHVLGNFQLEIPLNREGWDLNYTVVENYIELEYKDEYLLEGIGWEVEVSGKLHRIIRTEKTFKEDIELGEIIKTDENTQKEIIIPDVGEVTLDRNTEIKIEDETSIEQFNGELRSKVRELHPDALKIRMPVSVTSDRGTEFITKVEDGGENVLIVLKGEVEFSDIEKKKTVIVKENQMSVVKPGELPTDPLRIDPETIRRWWE